MTDPRQLSLSRLTDPPESHAAARSSRDLTGCQKAVLELLRLRGPLTDLGIERDYPKLMAEYGWPAQSPSGLRTRRHELVEADRVFRCGTTREAVEPGARRYERAVWKAA